MVLHYYIVESWEKTKDAKQLRIIHLINFYKNEYVQILINRREHKITIKHVRFTSVEYNDDKIALYDPYGEIYIIERTTMSNLKIELEIDRGRKTFLETIKMILENLVPMIRETR